MRRGAAKAIHKKRGQNNELSDTHSGLEENYKEKLLSSLGFLFRSLNVFVLPGVFCNLPLL